MIKGIIFDLDGTTLNTLKDIHESFNKAFRKYGLEEKSLDEVRMGVGNGFRVLTKKLIPEDIKEETVEEIALCYQKTYTENYYKNTRPYEGVSELLSDLQKQGIQMAVNSNKSDVFVKDLIARNFPEIRFTEVCGSLDGVALKPDPEGVYRILKLMGLSKKEVLYVGDSETDMKTAKNAGLKSVGVLWGFRDYETLKENGADHIIERPEELLTILKESE